MSDGQGVIRAVSWRDLCPWLIIFRTFGLSIRGSLLLAATLAVIILPLGWNLARVSFLSEESLENAEFKAFVDTTCSWPRYRPAFDASDVTPGGLFSAVWSRSGVTSRVFQSIVGPFRGFFQTSLNWQQTAYYLFGALWTLAVWAFFGGVITRVAAVELGREERLSLREAVVFSGRKYLAFFIAPLAPLPVVLVVLIPGIVAGLLMRADIALPLAGLLWFFVILGGFVSALALLGLLFGWPLMWGTVSAEGSDAFDALSRGYAYTFQRPLHYLFYSVLAVLFGALCWTLVSLFSDAVIQLAFWATGWGVDIERFADIQSMIDPTGEPAGMQWFGVSLIVLFTGLVRCVAAGFAFSFFWCVATAIYLLLRYDVDQTEFDEIYMDDEQTRFSLPPLARDLAGVPAPPTRGTETSPPDTASVSSTGDASGSPDGAAAHSNSPSTPAGEESPSDGDQV